MPISSTPTMPKSSGAAAWNTAVTRLRADADHALVTRTRDGLAIGPLHVKAEPQVRQAWRATGTPVVVVQRADHPDPSEAGLLAAADTGHGSTGLSLVCAGAVAARSFGLTEQGIGAVIDAIDPGGVALRCEFPASGRLQVLDGLLGAVDRRGYDPANIALEAAADPLGDAARQGDARLASDGVADAAGRWALGTAERGLAGPALRADGRIHHEAGATEAQELGAVLSTAVFYLRALDRAGVAVEPGAVCFTLAADANQPLTASKFRALRRLWARVEQLCGLEPAPVRLHAETAWRMLSRTDPWSNVLRNTIGCAGAILGGADSVSVLPFTSAIGLPDGFARRLARNTPLVLIEEAGLAAVADPCAGSGAYEALTDALCHEAWRVFQELEAAGGLEIALETGEWQRRVATARAARGADLAAGTLKLVGVTAFTHPDQPQPAVLLPAPPQQAGRGALPSIRDAEAFETGLSVPGRDPAASEGAG